MKRNAVRRLLASAAAACLVLPAAAQEFPSGPVRIVVPFTPGGPGDVLGREIARRMAGTWKHPIVVDNRPGAGTQIGTDAVAKAAPDGHTMGIVTTAHLINASLRQQLPYDTTGDLRGVSQLVVVHLAFLASPALGAKNLAEVIELSKGGRPVTYGTVPATTGHLAGALLNLMTGTRLEFVPYKGARDATNDAIAGRLDLTANPLTRTDLELLRAGRLKAIALTTDRRSIIAPEIPLGQDTVPGYVATGFMGMVVPKATPTAVVRRIQADIARAFEGKEATETLLRLAMEPLMSTPEQFDEFIASDIRKWREVVRATGAGTTN